MAQRRGRTLRRIIGLAVIAALAAAVILGTGKIDFGALGLGTEAQVYAPQESTESIYDIRIEVVDTRVLLNGEEITMESLSDALRDASNKTVLLIDKMAKHTTYSEVKDLLEEKKCIIAEWMDKEE